MSRLREEQSNDTQSGQSESTWMFSFLPQCHPFKSQSSFFQEVERKQVNYVVNSSAGIS